MRYQTRVDSDDDWESVVLNLVRRPSGIAWEYVREGRVERDPARGERVIYTLENMLSGYAILDPSEKLFPAVLALVWHQASAVQRSMSEAIAHQTGAVICPCSLKRIQI